MSHRREGQITLGELIELLEAREQGHMLSFDFGGCVPVRDGIASYRGYYEDLALDYNHDRSYPLVDEFLPTLKSALGQTFEGYKGGDYVAKRSTLLWVANWGATGSTIVTGLVDCDYMTVIATAWNDS